MERLWMLIHLSFFGMLAPSALSLTLCQPLAKPHHPSCSSQTLPVSLIYCRVTQVSLKTQKLRIPTPIQAPPGLKKGFCFVFMLSQEKPSPKSAPQGLPWLELCPGIPCSSLSEERAGEVVMTSLELPLHRMNLCPWKMGQPSSALDTFSSFTKSRNRNMIFFKKTN